MSRMWSYKNRRSGAYRMMEKTELEEKIKEIEEAVFYLTNIDEGSVIGRFKFTNKETQALEFSIDFLNANLTTFKEEL